MEQASFTVSSWQEQPIDNLNENFPVNQASATYQLSGALSGTASVEYLMTYQGSSMADGLEAVAQVVGFLHFEGTYLGKKGTFTACEKGTFTQGLLDCPGELYFKHQVSLPVYPVATLMNLVKKKRFFI